MCDKVNPCKGKSVNQWYQEFWDAYNAKKKEVDKCSGNAIGHCMHKCKGHLSSDSCLNCMNKYCPGVKSFERCYECMKGRIGNPQKFWNDCTNCKDKGVPFGSKSGSKKVLIGEIVVFTLVIIFIIYMGYMVAKDVAKARYS